MEKKARRQDSEQLPEPEEIKPQNVSPPPELERFTAKTQAIKITPELA